MLRSVSFESGGPNRRIVLATNVAETSVTIPGIVYVIDSGMAPGESVESCSADSKIAGGAD